MSIMLSNDQAYWVTFLFLNEFWEANMQAYNDDLGYDGNHD